MDYDLFKNYVDKDKPNHAFQHAMGNWGSLSPYNQEDCLESLHDYLKNGSYLTTKTLSQIKACIPSIVLDSHSLIVLMDSPVSPPELLPGQTYCLSAITEGYVYYIQISEINPPESRRTVLDPIGRTLFRAIEKVFNRMVLWDPYRYDFRIHDSQGHEVTVDGRSKELSLALALCSYVIGKPVPKIIAASATVGYHGQLGKVESLVEKLSALALEKDYVNKIIIAADQMQPDSSMQELSQVRTLEEVLAKVWPDIEAPEVAAQIDVERELNELGRLYKNYHIPTCLENSNRLIRCLKSGRCRDHITDQDRQRALFTCYWRIGSCRLHMGHPVQAMNDLERAMSIHRIRKGVIGAKDLQSLRITWGVCLKDLFQYEEAERLYREVDQALEGEHLDLFEKGKNLSSLSQLFVAMGRYEEAEELQKAAIECVDDCDKPRNLYTLAQLYTAWGKYPLSSQTFKKSKKLHAGQSLQVGQLHYLPFMDWVEAELHFRWATDLKRKQDRKPHWNIVQRIAESYAYPDGPPYVREFIKRFLGLVYLQQGRAEEGLDLLDQVIKFFEAQSEPIMKVLGALVRAERSLHLLSVDDKHNVLSDLRAIMRILSRQKQIKDFFQDEISIAKRILSRRTLKATDKLVMFTLLNSVRKKIQY